MKTKKMKMAQATDGIATQQYTPAGRRYRTMNSLA